MDWAFQKQLERLGALTAARAICAAHGLPRIETLRERSRMMRPAAARHEFCAWLRIHVGMSYPDIGALLDRDHTTIIAAVRKVSSGAKGMDSPGTLDRLAIPRDSYQELEPPVRYRVAL